LPPELPENAALRLDAEAHAAELPFTFNEALTPVHALDR